MLEWLQSDVTNYKGRIVSENFSVYKSDLKKIEVISALDDKFAIAKTQKIALELEKSNVEVIGLDCEWARIFNWAEVFKIIYDFMIVELVIINYSQQVYTVNRILRDKIKSNFSSKLILKIYNYK